MRTRRSNLERDFWSTAVVNRGSQSFGKINALKDMQTGESNPEREEKEDSLGNNHTSSKIIF